MPHRDPTFSKFRMAYFLGPNPELGNFNYLLDYNRNIKIGLLLFFAIFQDYQKILLVTMYEYMMADNTRQMTELILRGHMVTTLQKGNKLFHLYSLDTFFIEVRYDGVAKKNARRKIFASGKELDKYVDLRGFAFADD